MIYVLAAFLISLALSAAFTPLVRRVALSTGIVDAPTTRRVHTRPIPRVGGVAIFVAFFLPIVGAMVFVPAVQTVFRSKPWVFVSLGVGAATVAVLGLRDDLVNVGAKKKLLFQTMAACLAYAGGMRIEGISWPPVGAVEFGIWSLPITVIWIVGMINALNFIDGLDGLAGGIAFFACLTNFMVAWLAGRNLVCFAYGALAGATLGFLFYNFNPAKIFMGDCGSMFLGFMLACISLVGSGSQKIPTVIAVLVPLLAMGVPVMDMLFAIARRFLARRSIFSPDRGHIHHRLLDVGFSQRRAVLTLYGLTALLTLLALSLYVGRSWQVGATLSILCAVLVAGTRFLGKYASGVTSATQRFHDDLTRKLRQGIPGVLPTLDQARTADELPRILRRFAEDHGLVGVTVEPAGSGIVQSWRWEAPSVNQKNAGEIPKVGFSIETPAGQTVTLRFYVDTPDARVLPQTEILLQLIADAAESLLRRVSTRPPPPPTADVVVPVHGIPPLRAVGGE